MKDADTHVAEITTATELAFSTGPCTAGFWAGVCVPVIILGVESSCHSKKG